MKNQVRFLLNFSNWDSNNFLNIITQGKELITSKSKTHHSTINTSSSYNRNNLFMNFKLIRGFSIKGLDLNSKRVINPKLEKKNL